MRWQKDDLVHHFVEALDQAEVTHAPFSHLFAQNLFPQDAVSASHDLIARD